MGGVAPEADFEGDAARKRTYRLQCKVKAFKRTIHEEHASYESIICCLVPEPTAQAMAFYHAWLPETPEENPEVPGKVQHPYSQHVRLVVKAGPDKNNVEGRFDGPYLYVMTVATAKFLLQKKAGQIIPVTIQGEDKEDDLDQMPDDDGGSYDHF